jgi:hypothetical protein
MSTLFTPEGNYTAEAHWTENTLHKLLGPLFKDSANPREMLAMVIMAATTQMSTVILERQMETIKQKRDDALLAIDGEFLSPDETALVAKGDKIGAIKSVKARTRWDLVTCKMLVEKFMPLREG